MPGPEPPLPPTVPAARTAPADRPGRAAAADRRAAPERGAAPDRYAVDRPAAPDGTGRPAAAGRSAPAGRPGAPGRSSGPAVAPARPVPSGAAVVPGASPLAVASGGPALVVPPGGGWDGLGARLRQALARYGRPRAAVVVYSSGPPPRGGGPEAGGDRSRPQGGANGHPGGPGPRPGVVTVVVSGRYAVVAPPGCGCRPCRTAEPGPVPAPFAVDALAGLVVAQLEGADRARLLDLWALTVRGCPLPPDPVCAACAVCAGTAATPAAAPPAAATPAAGPPVGGAAGRVVPELGPSPEHRPGSARVRDLAAVELPHERRTAPGDGPPWPAVTRDLTALTTETATGQVTVRVGGRARRYRWSGHADSFGRAARRGLLAGLERHAAAGGTGPAVAVRDSLAALTARGRPVLDPRRCGLYAPRLQPPAGRGGTDPPPFTPEGETGWVWGYSLREERPLLVPQALARDPDARSGCATGGSLAEAVHYALLEIIERDAALLSWYGRAALPELDPASSARPATRRLLDRLALYGYRVRCFDTRISFPVPVITAVAVRADGGPGALAFGTAAGLDAEAVLAAALREAAAGASGLPGRTRRAAGRLRAIAADPGLLTDPEDHPLLYGLPEMAAHAEFLLGAPGAPPAPRYPVAERFADDAVPPHAADLLEDLYSCLDVVTDAGHDVVLLDQTPPGQRRLGLFTVRVLVPGLLPLDHGWSRQRARRMPRVRTALHRAGRAPRELSAADLNPAPHPFR